MKLVKVSESVYADVDGVSGGNVGIVVTGEGVIAVDSQYPGSAALFRKQIGEVTLKPVTRLLLTHIHGDHVFGAQVFEDCDIVAHRRLLEKARGYLASQWSPEALRVMVEDARRNTPERAWLYEGLRVVLPKTVFDEETRIGPVRVIHTGGHTDCSCIAHLPEERVLFSGDTIFNGRFPFAGDETADPDAWIEAFRTILRLGAEMIVPGHGPLCGPEEAEKQLRWFGSIRGEMRDLIAAGASEEQAARHGYPELYPAATPERMQGGFRRWFRVWSSRMGSAFQPSG